MEAFPSQVCRTQIAKMLDKSTVTKTTKASGFQVLCLSKTKFHGPQEGGFRKAFYYKWEPERKKERGAPVWQDWVPETGHQ